MIPGIFGLWPLLLGVLAAQPGLIEQSVTRLVIQDEVILKVPVQPHPAVRQFDWVEKKGPKCIPVAPLRRAFMSGPQQIDFIFARGGRVRAKLDEDCPALDFYGQFYLQLQDERLCVHRDAIRSRMGGSCMIEQFNQLVPKLRQ